MNYMGFGWHEKCSAIIMKVALVSLGAAAMLAHSAPSSACGALDEPYYVPSQQWPTGEDVPLNAPLAVQLAKSAEGSAEPHLDARLTLTALGTDEPLELMPSGSTPHLVWVPRQPLTPSTTYEASFNTGYEGAPDHVWQFTTGQTTTPPIALEGELSAELVPGIDPILDCPQCSGACVQTGERNVTKALVRLPRVKGGFAGRTGHVWLTDDTPYDFREPRKLPPLPNEQHLVSLSSFVVFGDDGLPTQDVLITLPEESEPYRPCFAFVVSDERSEGAFAEPFCLDEAFPLSSAQPETVSDEAVTGGDSSACSFGVASSRRAYAAFALLALAALTRRRRSKIAL